MFNTIEEKKKALEKGRDKLRREFGLHDIDSVRKMCNALTADPIHCLMLSPGMLAVVQLCVGITLGELLIERELAEQEDDDE